jgi:hypothetical protein
MMRFHLEMRGHQRERSNPMNRYISRPLFLLIVVSLILAGCGAEKSTATPTPVPPSPTPVPPTATATPVPPTATPTPVPPTATATPAPSGALPDDPFEALKAINQASMELKSAHFTMDMDMDMDIGGSSVTMVMTAVGDVEMTGPSPEDANMQMEMTISLLGQTVKMELVAVNGQYWTREEGKSWQSMPATSASPFGGLGGDPTAALKYLEQAKDLKRLKDEKVDGVDCYHFSFVMDTETLATPEMLGQITGSGQLTAEQARKILETAVLEAEAWVGKEDLFLRRQVIDMTFEISGLPELGDTIVKYDMQIDLRFSQINEPVEIKAPTG